MSTDPKKNLKPLAYDEVLDAPHEEVFPGDGPAPVPLPERFRDVVAACIDEKGVFPHQCISVKDGKATMHAMMLSKPAEVYACVLAVMFKDRPDELIFGLDRWCQPCQGTTLGDCIAGAYWDGMDWRTFIIEYRHEPRLVLPVCWDNPFWSQCDNVFSRNTRSNHEPDRPSSRAGAAAGAAPQAARCARIPCPVVC